MSFKIKFFKKNGPAHSFCLASRHGIKGFMERIIRITNDDSEISFDKESSLLELLISKKIDIDHSCGGMGTCGTCKVFVKSDPKHLPKRNDIEQERANDLNFSDSERLACQLPPFNKLAIEIP